MNKVLIIDDDYASVYLTKSVLEEMQVTEQIVTATNGQEGLEKVKQYCLNGQAAPLDCPDLILLDLNMPVMDGFEVLEELKRIGQSNLIEAKIIVLTSSSNKKDIEKVEAMGIKNFLVKPLTEDKLMPLISS